MTSDTRATGVADVRTGKALGMTRDDSRLRVLRRHPYLRIALLAAAAATAAWTAGSLAPAVSPLVAAITALVALRPTFHDSLREGVRQVVGTVIGAAAAAAVVLTAGFTPLTLFVAVLVSYLAARLLRLGEEGAVTISITVLLVAVNLDGSAVEARFLGVVLGSVVGMAASWWARPGTPADRALEQSVRHAGRLAALLTEVSEGLAARAAGRPVDPGVVRAWRVRAEGIARDLAATRVDAEEAVAATRLMPAAARAETAQVLAQVRVHEATAATVVGMCRDLLVASAREDLLPPPVVGPLSEVFAAAADALSRQAGTARANPAEPLADDVTAVRALADASQDAASRLRALEATAPLKIGGSLLADGDEISRLLTGR